MYCLVLPVIVAVAGAVTVDSRARKRSTEQINCETDHVLIYTLGKTGSTALQYSLRNLCDWIPPEFPFIEELQDSYPQNAKMQLTHDVAADYLSKLPPNSTVWVITMVRNPFERLISAFFQVNWCNYRQGDGTETVEVTDGAVSDAMRDLHNVIAHSVAPADYGDYYEDWVRTTGVPILDQNFDTTKKHIFLQSDQNERRLNTILLRQEDIGEWGSILAPYFPGLEMAPANEADEKDYAELYENFKASFAFTQSEVDELKSRSRELKFYSSEEIDSMLNSLHLLRDGQALYRRYLSASTVDDLEFGAADRVSTDCTCTCRNTRKQSLSHDFGGKKH